MKKHLLRISMLAALAVSASQAETYYATMPFSFVVGNKTAPAGEYVIDPSAGSDVVIIKSANHKEGFAVMGTNVTSADYPRASRLVFHRYGNRYFLAEIWTRGSDAGRRIQASPEERELLAQGKIHRTQTTVALR